MSRVTIEFHEHVAEVRLSRPEKLNAFDQAMIEAVVAAAGEVNREDVRAVVLSGEGRAFSAGLDVSSFASLATGDPHALIEPRTHGDANLFQQVALAWHDLPVPVIAAVHGVCFGAGFQMALGADIRVAAPDAQLAVMEMKWGLVPDMGGMVLLPRLAGSDVIRRLVYTARTFTGEEALNWGLVTELSPDPGATALGLAREIASRSPSAIRAAKRLINFAESGAARADVLMAESREQAALIGSPHQLEAVAANMQKRKPDFR